MPDDDECPKCGNSDLWMCIEMQPGNWHTFGPCSDERCGGVCEDEGRCVCECHQARASLTRR